MSITHRDRRKKIKVVVFDLEELCNPKIEDSKLWRRVTQAVQGESDVMVAVNKRALVISEKSWLWVRDVWEGTIPRLESPGQEDHENGYF